MNTYSIASSPFSIIMQIQWLRQEISNLEFKNLRLSRVVFICGYVYSTIQYVMLAESRLSDIKLTELKESLCPHYHHLLAPILLLLDRNFTMEQVKSNRKPENTLNLKHNRHHYHRHNIIVHISQYPVPQGSSSAFINILDRIVWRKRQVKLKVVSAYKSKVFRRDWHSLKFKYRNQMHCTWENYALEGLVFAAWLCIYISSQI